MALLKGFRRIRGFVAPIPSRLVWAMSIAIGAWSAAALAQPAPTPPPAKPPTGKPPAATSPAASPPAPTSPVPGSPAPASPTPTSPAPTSPAPTPPAIASPGPWSPAPAPASTATVPTTAQGRVLTGAERNPVVGSVDGRLIYLSDVGRLLRTLPEDARELPFDRVMPTLIDRLIDHAVLAMAARRIGLDRRPDIQRDMQAAADTVLENALIDTFTPSRVNDAAILARFNLLHANRPPTDQVRARHILVATEAEAKAIILDLKKGADFAAIARARSKDPDGKAGGDIGFFSRDRVWPGFADVAFSLQPGETSQVPVHNEFGWHVVRVEERRLLAPPTLGEIREQLRDELVNITIDQLVAEARSNAIVHRFNLDGSEIDPNPRLRSATPDLP